MKNLQIKLSLPKQHFILKLYLYVFHFLQHDKSKEKFHFNIPSLHPVAETPAAYTQRKKYKYTKLCQTQQSLCYQALSCIICVLLSFFKKT